jgi:hypothetical protein
MPDEDAVPIRDLAERLFNAPLWVGALPPDLPLTSPFPSTAELVPPGGRLVGSLWSAPPVTDANPAIPVAPERIEIIVDAPGEPADLIAFFARAFQEAGWQIPATWGRWTMGFYCRAAAGESLTLNVWPRAGLYEVRISALAARRSHRSNPFPAALAGALRDRPALRDFLFVVAIGAVRVGVRGTLTLHYLDAYTDGFNLHGRLTPMGQPPDPPGGFGAMPRLTFTAHDDRGGAYAVLPGGIGGNGQEWRFDYTGTPALDPRARALVVAVTGLTWEFMPDQNGDQPPSIEFEVGPEEWAAVIPLPA